jgi:hypothetical protein
MNVMDSQAGDLLVAERTRMGLHIQMSANSLLGSDVVHVCPCQSKSSLVSWAAAYTGASFLDRAEIIGKLFIV